MPLESIEIPQLIFSKGWIRPPMLVRHLNLGECGFPGLNIRVVFGFWWVFWFVFFFFLQHVP